MRRIVPLLLVVTVAVAAVVWLMYGGPAPAPESREAAAPAAQTAEEPDAVPDSAGREPDSEKTAEEDGEESLPPGLTEEEARRRRREMALQEAAESRFDQTVETDGLDADEVEPEVRDLFRTVTLEPVVDPDQGQEGRIEGLRIMELTGNSPLIDAGFSEGDLLVRMDGRPLADPAQIAHLTTQLSERVEICAANGSGERCRVVTLANQENGGE